MYKYIERKRERNIWSITEYSVHIRNVSLGRTYNPHPILMWRLVPSILIDLESTRVIGHLRMYDIAPCKWAFPMEIKHSEKHARLYRSFLNVYPLALGGLRRPYTRLESHSMRRSNSPIEYSQGKMDVSSSSLGGYFV